MALIDVVDDEFVQPLRGAVVGDDLVATGQMLDSISIVDKSTENKQVVEVLAMDYILLLRDGEQYKEPPTLTDIQEWLDAKGLALDAGAVLGTILSEGTTWDQKGGSQKLQEVLNEQNIQQVMNIAIEQETKKILDTKWQLR